jgi:dienelactone hydrolase
MLLAAFGGSTRAAERDPLKRAGIFGARLGPVTTEVRKTQNLPTGRGALVTEVFPNLTAADGGIEPGDVITAIGEVNVPDPSAFVAALSGRKSGDRVKVTLVRDRQTVTRDLTLKPRPREQGTDAYDVIYDSVPSRAGRLRTILTRPRSAGGESTPTKHPALFVIQGVGGFSIENGPGGIGIYTQLIDEFSRHRYVSLRVEKPGQGDSEGGPTREVDFESELDGYRQGLKALKAQPFVDAEKVLIFGHSMGGVMAPLIAAENPVKGIAAYGTLVKSWQEYMIENTRRQAALEGRPASQIDQDVKKDAVLNVFIYGEGKSPKAVAEAHPELAARISEYFPDGIHFVGRHYLFFHQLAQKNLADAWEKFDGHVLALWGKADYVSTEADHALIAAIVEKRHAGHGRFLALEGIDHAFNRASTQEESQRKAGRPGEFNPLVITTLREWASTVNASTR